MQNATNLIGLFPIGIGIMYFLMFLPAWMVERELDRHGAQTQGVISNPKSHSHIYYTFTVKGCAYQGETHMNYERFKDLHTGQPIVVRYLPNDPQTNHISGGPERRGANFGIGVGISMMLLSPVLFLTKRKQDHKETRQTEPNNLKT